MKKAGFVPIVAIAFGFSAAQTTNDANFKLALPEHRGQLIWSVDGFKIIQSSAKPNGRELGIRGKDESGRLTFLGFLFLLPDQAPLTSASCRDGVMDPEKKSDAHLKILATLDSTRPDGPPVSLVSYTTRGDNGKAAYMVRGFTGSGDICGDLEFYSDTPISADDAALKRPSPAIVSTRTTLLNSTTCLFMRRPSIRRACIKPRLQFLKSHWRS